MQYRIDVYNDIIACFDMTESIPNAKVISADNLTYALLSNVNLNSGLLPHNILFWRQCGSAEEYGLWEPPRIRKIAITIKALEAPRRFTIPVPGLVFICRRNSPPYVYAAKRRPEKLTDKLYKAPFFNVYGDGRTCAGNNTYPDNILEIPDYFFMTFFSLERFQSGSKSHPDSLIALYEEIENKKKYPLEDLVEWGPIERIL